MTVIYETKVGSFTPSNDRFHTTSAPVTRPARTIGNLNRPICQTSGLMVKFNRTDLGLRQRLCCSWLFLSCVPVTSDVYENDWNYMKTLRALCSLSLLGFFGNAAYATLVCVPGPDATVAQVQASNTTCVANNAYEFGNFSFTSQAAGTTALDPTDVVFQILQASAVGPYLIFPETFNVVSPPAGNDVDSSFMLAYSVVALNGTMITGFDGHLIGTAAHHGTSLISIDYCAGAPIGSCPAGQGGALDVSSITSIQFVTLPSAVASLNFLITGTIDSPDQGSAAGMTSFEMGFQSGTAGGTSLDVPEPATAFSLSLGLLLLGIGIGGRLRHS